MRLLPFFFFILHIIPTSAQLDSCSIFPNQDSIFIQSDCDQRALICTNISSEAINNYQFKNRGRIVEATQDCNFDTLSYYSVQGSVILVNIFAPFFVDRWQVNDTYYSGSFSLIPQLIDSLNTWDIDGNWVFNETKSRIEGGSPDNTYGDLLIEILLLNTSANFRYVIEYMPQSKGIALPVGEHLLTANNNDFQCKDTLFAAVVCTTADTMYLEMQANQTKTICFEATELVGEITNISTPENVLNFDWTYLSDGCIELTGKTIGNDTMPFIACDKYGICDTTFLIYNINTTVNSARQTTLRVGETGRFCINPRTIGLPGDIISFTNACRNATTGKATFAFDREGLCMRFQGTAIGKDSACIAICDNFGNCDTINYRLHIVEPSFVKDTILTNYDTLTYCLSTESLTGRSITIEEDCRNNYKQEIINYEIDPKNFCITYTGVQNGCDSLCVWLRDELGNAALTVLQICATQPQPSSVEKRLYINQTIEFCVDTSELPGLITDFYNFCPLSSGEIADFFIHRDYCVEISGLTLGKEQACLVICDDLGFCDTTYLTGAVIPYPFPPDAVNDTTATDQENSIIIQVLSNDDLTGGNSYIEIASPPKYGVVILNDDGTITYFPDAQSCRGMDTFSYLLCNANGCDNAAVTVEVDCDGIEIFTGFSPNGDGINDYFFIANIESNPINTLQIFNQWGNMIYEKESYQNNWDGRWNNKLLPDGTYYYLLEIEVEGKKTTYRGSVELQR